MGQSVFVLPGILMWLCVSSKYLCLNICIILNTLSKHKYVWISFSFVQFILQTSKLLIVVLGLLLQCNSINLAQLGIKKRLNTVIEQRKEIWSRWELYSQTNKIGNNSRRTAVSGALQGHYGLKSLQLINSLWGRMTLCSLVEEKLFIAAKSFTPNLYIYK